MARALQALLVLAACALAAQAYGPLQEGRRLLQAGNSFTPAGGSGSWSSGHPSGVIAIHAAVMKDGKVAVWTPMGKGVAQTSSLVDPVKGTAVNLMQGCAFYGCKNAFCGAQVTTPDSEILIFGGHSTDTQYFRRFNYATRTTQTSTMASNRWYLGTCTLPDGKVIAIGGVKQSGYAGWGKTDPSKNNVAYEIYDPVTNTFGGDRFDMKQQLASTFPVGTYPVSGITPDGGLFVSSGNTLYKYKRSDYFSFVKEFAYDPRPSPSWGYPQTGQGVLLPLSPPYNRAFLMAAGGSSLNHAGDNTPASSAAHIIELTAGPGANWESVGPMPYPRVMGDGIILCDGTVLFHGGAQQGTAGWGSTPRKFHFRDGTTYNCPTKCGHADKFNFEPVIYDPVTQRFSKKGSLAQAMHPRAYHSSTVLLPDCRVMASGSDVSGDHTAEFFSPPHLSKGPRPVITSAPEAMRPGAVLRVGYASADPVTRAIMIRTGASTHSMQFDLRALWLDIDVGPNVVTINTPASYTLTPPGMYMIVLLSSKGVPSKSTIISVAYPDTKRG